jgi:hypothetical protein
VAVVGAFAIVCWKTGIPFSDLTRDTSEILHVPFYLGVLSHLGILVWSASAALCLFAAAAGPPQSEFKERRLYLVAAGLLTLWLALDDLLTLHEIVLPNLLSVRQRMVIAAYIVIVFLFLFRFRKVILKTEFPILVAAFGFFGVSVVADAIQSRFTIPAQHYVEDGSKLMGIVGWTVYFARTAWRHVRERAGSGGDSPSSAARPPTAME